MAPLSEEPTSAVSRALICSMHDTDDDDCDDYYCYDDEDDSDVDDVTPWNQRHILGSCPPSLRIRHLCFHGVMVPEPWQRWRVLLLLLPPSLQLLLKLITDVERNADGVKVPPCFSATLLLPLQRPLTCHFYIHLV